MPMNALRPPRLALVLSAGCLRGYAHIGVLKALEEAGIRPDLVVGASAGAIVGALYAAGRSPTEIERAGDRLVVADLKRWALSRRGLWRGDALESLLRSLLPVARIEHFPIRFAAVATDVASGRLAVFERGDAARAAHASAAMPGLFVPARIDGRWYADAGLRSPLPVRVARELGAQTVLAVNIVCDPCDAAGGLLARLLRPVRLLVHALAEHEAAGADLAITPRLADSDDRRTMIDAGARATQALLPRLRALRAGSYRGARHGVSSAAASPFGSTSRNLLDRFHAGIGTLCPSAGA